MPVNIPLHVPQDCPVVGHAVVLTRDRTFLDYLLIREGAATCSNLHTCLREYGEIKKIPACLLHDASKYFPADDVQA
jgi:hypothetical protein